MIAETSAGQAASEVFPGVGPLRVLVLYDELSTYTATVLEYLQSFSTFSKHSIYYASGVRKAQVTIPLEAFDAVIVHYSVRLSMDDCIAPSYASALAKYEGLKILFIQDEYESTETARRWIGKLGFRVVFTCVPEGQVAMVYEPSRFPNVEFISILTGFIPIRFESGGTRRPLAERPLYIAYRGRNLAYWYGALGQEKQLIGQRMKAICEERRIPADIEWEERHRIYGERWYEFLSSARATLGTESGANVFDDDGSLRQRIKAEVEADSSLTFEEISARYLVGREGPVRMNQISPKVFEAIALGTALVLFEGEYSGVIRPWEHYIPLKKDFSNVDDVLAKLDDLEFLEAMTARAHADIVMSGRYSYRATIERVDRILEHRVRKRSTLTPFGLVLGFHNDRWQGPQIHCVERNHAVADFPTTAPLDPQLARRSIHVRRTPSRELVSAAWAMVPKRVRRVLLPPIQWVRFRGRPSNP